MYVFKNNLWLCPEHFWVIGGITLPVVVDESYWNQADVFFYGIGAIVTLRVETVVFLADEIIEIFRHVILQIVLLGLLVLVVPVGRLAEY